MTRAETVKTRLGMLLAVFVFLAGSLWVMILCKKFPQPAIQHPSIIDSAYLVFALWSGSAMLMLQTRRPDWRIDSGSFQLVRITWALAFLMYVVHLVVAFHFAHRWQHANAYDHVHQTSGFGPGIFISYLFSLLWFADLAWFVFKPGSYVRRSNRIRYGWHGFFTFILFNATVVFGHGPMRWVSGGVMVFLGVYGIASAIVPSNSNRNAESS